MKKYITLSALALTGAMILTACGPKEPDPTPTPEITETPGVVESVQPTETPEVSAEPQPTESASAVTPPAETDGVKPVETQTPTPEPTAAPSEAPEASLTAADIYAKVSAVAGGNPMSDVGATTEEIFIAKVKSGKLDAVKSACQSRQQDLKDNGSMYPSAAVYVEASQIVTNGDWILFVVVAEPSAAVSAFNGCF